MKRHIKRTVIKTDCGCLSECPPARDENGAPTTRNVIAAFFHCRKCLQELPRGESPRSWAQLEVGFTEIGLQVYCKRHEINVMHIDFQGQQHPANLQP
jgi:hypothetical protein